MSATRIACHVNAPRQMTITFSLADNEAGWRSSLAKLAALAEARAEGPPDP